MPEYATKAELEAKTLESLADVEGSVGSRKFLKGNKDGTAFKPVPDPVVNIEDFGADLTGESDSSAAFSYALEALPPFGGRLLLPPGWYVANNVPVSKSNVEIAGFGSIGNGLGGVFGTKSFAATVLSCTAPGGRSLILDHASGGLEWRGATLRNLTFADGTTGHNQAAAGVLIREMANNRFVSTSFLSFLDGTSIEQETGKTEYNIIEDLNVYQCKIGLAGLGPDLQLDVFMFKGASASSAEPVAGSVGLRLGSISRYCNGVVQSFETNLAGTVGYGNNQVDALRIETRPTWTTVKAKHAINLASETGGNQIAVEVVNPNAYGEKPILVASNNNVIVHNLKGENIEDGGERNMFIGTQYTKLAAEKLGFFGATPIAKPTVTGSKGSNAALGSLMTRLSELGLVTDSTT